jgi:hypothetical protein
MASVLLLAAAVTVAVSKSLEDVGGDSGDQVISVAPATSTSTTAPTTTTAATPKTTAQVHGTVTAVHIEGAVLDPREVPTPLTITADRGFGNGGRINGVTVDGLPATIEWDAGRPFVLTSGPALVLDPVAVDLVPEGLRLGLADAVHAFAPGEYRLDTPVAVGVSGMAGARDFVVFQAGRDATFEPHGDAALVLDGSRPRHVFGPGLVHLEGSLELTDASGTREVERLDASEAPFDLVLQPGPEGGWVVTGRVGGAVTG